MKQIKTLLSKIELKYVLLMLISVLLFLLVIENRYFIYIEGYMGENPPPGPVYPELFMDRLTGKGCYGNFVPEEGNIGHFTSFKCAGDK